MALPGEGILHGYFRSSATWRVRIALHLKGLPYRRVGHHLLKGEQRDPAYLALNPQGLVPALQIGDAVITQSLAICEYLDEIVPEPSLLGQDPVGRAHVRAFALAIACEIHPLQNVGVLDRLRGLGLGQDAVLRWTRDTIARGFSACEKLLDPSGPFCFGDRPTLADICLVPQMANARRYGVELEWPLLERIEAQCLKHPAFAETQPGREPDFEA